MQSLNSRGQQFADHLKQYCARQSAVQTQRKAEDTVNIVGAGGALTAAYEQLRNAAENTEEHLLLQNAIKRFYKQLFLTRDEALVRRSGQELAVELTLAGYLPNDSLVVSQVETISELATTYYQCYEAMLARGGSVGKRALVWSLDVLAVEADSIIGNHGVNSVVLDFAYSQFENLVKESDLGAMVGSEDFGAKLYIAIQQSLLKADVATIRTGLLRRYGVSTQPLEQYIAVNDKIDRLLESSDVDALRRVVDRQGAPFRILRRMIDDEPDLPALIERKDQFLSRYEQQIHLEYERTALRINRAIIRSIVFLVITKFIIGIAIEIPYDYLVHGSIIWLPLIINLLFPPIYMYALKATHRLPGEANTRALIDRIDQMLYGSTTSLNSVRIKSKAYGPLFSALYVASTLLIFAASTYLLIQLQFSALHIIIFFVFLSGASFLGFRLSRFIRELEVIKSAQSGMTFVRDLLYLPFVVVGQWMSDKYSRINIVTIILDMLIELPLKTLLRLVRQWNAFIDDRKDQL